ncbi:MAG: ATP-binding protein [Bernardetiaceae bacterium]|nr:ATP-binding protein [Bernardetiaceae bacterium]
MISFQNIKQADALNEVLRPLKDKIELKINLKKYEEEKPIDINLMQMIRLCFLVGLSNANTEERTMESLENVGTGSNSIYETFSTKSELAPLYSALLKLRYQHLDIDWESTSIKNKIINAEIIKGCNILLAADNLDDWLSYTQTDVQVGSIPILDLDIGTYGDDIPAKLNLNGKNIPNTQILIAGTTGSGKSNLLAVLLQELRGRSIETSFPVNFLLFDYKGEFADPANSNWLQLFEATSSAILDPIKSPLPLNPFKNFVGKTQNEINLYATELSNALLAIDKATISANMSDRLSKAVIEAYKQNDNFPITFELILEAYTELQPERDQGNTDSVKSVLNQLIRSKLFEAEDHINLIKDSYIIKMDSFPKEGVLAKAIVYFVISKLSSYYETLPKQATDDKSVELRHFTIIDEAHYMLNFENKPLQNLIAIGRNKGLSIILATQNMDSYKSKYFDFYANAQYPLIMKQQSINDKTLKDLFGVSGKNLQELKEEINSLQKGEVILKDEKSIALGIGKCFKKMKVRHLI